MVCEEHDGLPNKAQTNISDACNSHHGLFGPSFFCTEMCAWDTLRTPRNCVGRKTSTEPTNKHPVQEIKLAPPLQRTVIISPPIQLSLTSLGWQLPACKLVFNNKNTLKAYTSTGIFFRPIVAKVQSHFSTDVAFQAIGSPFWPEQLTRVPLCVMCFYVKPSNTTDVWKSIGYLCLSAKTSYQMRDRNSLFQLSHASGGE